MVPKPCSLILLAAFLAVTANGQRVAVRVNAGETSEPISKYVYGQFIEHHRTVVNGALWSEMLDDRKFFYPVASNEKQVPENRWIPDSQDWERRTAKRWRPIGPDEFVTMDCRHAYAGDHSPAIRLLGATPHGISQSGLVLRQGKSYTGRVALAGDSGAKVTVALVWGPNPNDRQTVTVGPPRSSYSKFPLKFVAGADAKEARLEIAATGTGPLYIGAVSLMPADSVQGFRPDTIHLLKELRSGVYRWPGGNFVSGYDWRDAIGDPDRRPQRFDYAWNSLEPNDVGTDEFMVLCGLLDVEPYITVNAGFGDARSAAEWVEYANGSVSTPMGRLRAANGHPAPYGIKWWGIGNEMYGSWQVGNMSLNHYVLKHNLFAKAMRQVDPSIQLLASGAALDEMTVTGNARRITGKVLAEFGGPADWTGGLLANCADNLDLVTEHFYCQDGRGYDLEKGQFVRVEEPLAEWARRPANRVKAKVEQYRDYFSRIPGLSGRKIGMNIDEWYYGQPNLRIGLSYAWAFHEMFRHTDIIKMAAYTFATRLINYSSTEASYNAHGLLFKLYRDHFGTVPVAVAGNSPQPAPKYPVGGDQPRVNAGSDTYPLDVAAALSADRKFLTVAIVNPTESAQEADFTCEGFAAHEIGRVWRLTGPDQNALNRLGHGPQVTVTETPFQQLPQVLAVPALSVSIFEFQVKP